MFYDFYGKKLYFFELLDLYWFDIIVMDIF